MTAPYRSNSLFAFLKTDAAFHGVDRIEAPGVVRDSMLYNIYVENLITQPVTKPEASKTSTGSGIARWFGGASR